MVNSAQGGCHQQPAEEGGDEGYVPAAWTLRILRINNIFSSLWL